MKALVVALLLMGSFARAESSADEVKKALREWEERDPHRGQYDKADLSEEIKARLRKWERDQPKYVPGPNVAPAHLAPSVTARYAHESTGRQLDPIAADFLARGYFVLHRLKHQREMAILNTRETSEFHEALRTTRIRVVDEPLVDNRGKRVTAVYNAPAISVFREDWNDARELGADLVRLVFHEYLRAIRKDDDTYVVSVRLLVTEKDFLKERTDTKDCPSGRWAPARIAFNLAFGYEGNRVPSYVNGRTVGSDRSFRTAETVPLCTGVAHRFDIATGNVSRSVYLYGGDDLTTRVPSGEEIYLY